MLCDWSNERFRIIVFCNGDFIFGRLCIVAFFPCE